MEKEQLILEDEKWNAVVNCDSEYDGKFYYAVKTTGIVCNPSCRAKAPLRKNVLFFNSISDAIKEGFRPCKLCRPDIVELDYEPSKMLVESVKNKIDKCFSNSIDLKVISHEFGISTSHLTRLFKDFYGISLISYIIKLRVNKASELLKQTDIAILEIADISGFKSMSNFYKLFKEYTGYTPREYRIKESRGNI